MRRPVLTIVFVGRVSSCDLSAVKSTLTDWLAATFTTIGAPPLKAAFAGCEIVTTEAAPVEETTRKRGSPPGALWRSVMSGGANQKSVPLCALDVLCKRVREVRSKTKVISLEAVKMCMFTRD